MNNDEILESLKAAHDCLLKKQYNNGRGKIGTLIRILERDEAESQKSAIPIVSDCTELWNQIAESDKHPYEKNGAFVILEQLKKDGIIRMNEIEV